MSVETISYEGHHIACVHHGHGVWSFSYLENGHRLDVSWSSPLRRMADRKAAARGCLAEADRIDSIWVAEKGFTTDAANEMIRALAGLGLFLALLSLVPS